MEQRRRKLDVESVCAFIFILPRHKDCNFLAMQRRGGGGEKLNSGTSGPSETLADD